MIDYLVSHDQAVLLHACWSLLIVAFILLILGVIWHHIPTEVPAGISLDMYETAALSHYDATAAVIDTAALRLVQLGVLSTTLEPRQLHIECPLPSGSHPLEEAVYRAVCECGAIEQVRLAARPVAEVVYDKVRSLGLCYSSVSRVAFLVLFLLVWIPLIVVVFYLGSHVPSDRQLPAVGASVVGLLGSPSGQGSLLAAATLFPGRPAADDRERSERWMAFGAVGAFMIVFCIMALGLYANPRTRRGQSLQVCMQRQHGRHVDSDPAWMVAVYGIDVLKKSRHAYLIDFFNPPPVPPDNCNPC